MLQLVVGYMVKLISGGLHGKLISGGLQGKIN